MNFPTFVAEFKASEISSPIFSGGGGGCYGKTYLP